MSERTIGYLLFAIAIMVFIVSFIPVGQHDFLETHTSFFKQSHREALWFYAGLFSVIGLLTLLWRDTSTFYSRLLAIIILGLTVLFTLSMICNSYFSNVFSQSYGLINTLGTYAILGILGLTPVYLIIKLTKRNQD